MVVAWIGSQRPEDCFLSVVSIGEIERGIARKRTSDAGFAQQLAGWLDQLLRLYGDRLLPVDVGVARRWGQLSAAIGHDGADLRKKERKGDSDEPDAPSTLSDHAEVLYKASGFWSKTCERSLLWNDPEVGIAWPLEQLGGAQPVLAEKDAAAPAFAEALSAGDVFA